jgi:hypoxanthine phosphoribosyltransferase
LKSYDYAHRKGVREITWIDFADMCTQLAEQLELEKPEVIIGIARAGLLPATTVACHMRRELYPSRLTRRVDDEVVYDDPVWKVPITSDVAGKTVAIVDEIADTGQTLAMAAKEARIKGASNVITACLVSHSWADPTPDISVLVTDELVIFPWDRLVLKDGVWRPHPEIVNALSAQNNSDEKSW